MARPVAKVFSTGNFRWWFQLDMHEPNGPHPSRAVAIAQLRHETAQLACRLLVAAYQRGKERGDHIDWDDVDAAYVAARAALNLPPDE